MTGTGRKRASSEVTQIAPTAGPYREIGAPKVLCRLKWAQVEAAVAGARDAERRVGVRLVEPAQTSGLVDDLGNPVDFRVEDSGVLGVVEQEPGRPFGDGRPHRVDLGVASRSRRDLDHPEPGRGSRRRVRGVGGELADRSRRAASHPGSRGTRGSRERRRRWRAHLRTPGASRRPCPTATGGSRRARRAGGERPGGIRRAASGCSSASFGERAISSFTTGGYLGVVVAAVMSGATLCPSDIWDRRVKWRSTCGWPSSGSVGGLSRLSTAGRSPGRPSPSKPGTRIPRSPGEPSAVTSGSCQAAAWKRPSALIGGPPRGPWRAGRCRPAYAAPSRSRARTARAPGKGRQACCRRGSPAPAERR